MELDGLHPFGEAEWHQRRARRRARAPQPVEMASPSGLERRHEREALPCKHGARHEDFGGGGARAERQTKRRHERMERRDCLDRNDEHRRAGHLGGHREACAGDDR